MCPIFATTVPVDCNFQSVTKSAGPVSKPFLIETIDYAFYELSQSYCTELVLRNRSELLWKSRRCKFNFVVSSITDLD